ncbi:MAG: DUF4190 domain-containing protein [Clostridium sp.]|nr:DUF4190 domain-containing protein [Clostridium sp.]
MDENQTTNKTEDTAPNTASDAPIRSAFEMKDSTASSSVTYYSAPERTETKDTASSVRSTDTETAKPAGNADTYTETAKPAVNADTYTETAKPAMNSDFYTASYNNNEAETPQGFAIASLVMGILSILSSCCCGFGSLFGILGIIFGCIQQKNENGQKPGMAIAGLITSGIGLLLGILSIIFFMLIDS